SRCRSRAARAASTGSTSSEPSMSFAISDLPARGARPLLAVVVLSALGCRLTMTPPESFLVLQTEGTQIKAMTADDARLWVREITEPQEGDLEFWSAALHQDLLARGYRALGEPADVTDGESRPGRLRTYELNAAGRAQGYLVALFVEQGSGTSTIRVAEFVAAKERFDELLPRVRESLATLRG